MNIPEIPENVEALKEESIFKILSDLPVDANTKWLFSFILTYLFNLSADESKLTTRVERLEIWTGR